MKHIKAWLLVIVLFCLAGIALFVLFIVKMGGNLDRPVFSMSGETHFVSPVCSDQGWKIVWQDEFDKDGLPSSSKWAYEVGFVRNNELQFYTPSRSENARVENGSLVIEARKDGFDGHDITSASLFTKQSWTYGRIEARAKMPRGFGVWPAIWTLGSNIEKVGWPSCGEIDIMEYVGFEPNAIYTSVHTPRADQGLSHLVLSPYRDFHVYTLDWYPDRLEFMIDGKNVYTYKKPVTDDPVVNDPDLWPFDRPQYLILNLAIGGAWGGQHGVDDSIFPSQYSIDYVRVYENCIK